MSVSKTGKSFVVGRGYSLGINKGDVAFFTNETHRWSAESVLSMGNRSYWHIKGNQGIPNVKFLLMSKSASILDSRALPEVESIHKVGNLETISSDEKYWVTDLLTKDDREYLELLDKKSWRKSGDVYVEDVPAQLTLLETNDFERINSVEEASDFRVDDLLNEKVAINARMKKIANKHDMEVLYREQERLTQNSFFKQKSDTLNLSEKRALTRKERFYRNQKNVEINNKLDPRWSKKFSSNELRRKFISEGILEEKLRRESSFNEYLGIDFFCGYSVSPFTSFDPNLNGTKGRDNSYRLGVEWQLSTLNKSLSHLSLVPSISKSISYFVDSNTNFRTSDFIYSIGLKYYLNAPAYRLRKILIFAAGSAGIGKSTINSSVGVGDKYQVSVIPSAEIGMMYRFSAPDEFDPKSFGVAVSFSGIISNRSYSIIGQNFNALPTALSNRTVSISGGVSFYF